MLSIYGMEFNNYWMPLDTSESQMTDVQKRFLQRRLYVMVNANDLWYNFVLFHSFFLLPYFLSGFLHLITFSFVHLSIGLCQFVRIISDSALKYIVIHRSLSIKTFLYKIASLLISKILLLIAMMKAKKNLGFLLCYICMSYFKSEECTIRKRKRTFDYCVDIYIFNTLQEYFTFHDRLLNYKIFI